MNKISDFILRPNRERYNPNKDLGPSIFYLGDLVIRRKDLTLYNSRGLAIECSHFIPLNYKKMHCVVYCHGNCGNRLDSLDTVESLLPKEISVFVFDFTGQLFNKLGQEFHKEILYPQGIMNNMIYKLLQIIQLLKKILLELLFEEDLWELWLAQCTQAKTQKLQNVLCQTLHFQVFNSLQKTLSKEYDAFLIFQEKSLMTKQDSKSQKELDSIFSKYFISRDIDPIQAASKCTLPCIFIHGLEDKLVNFLHTKRLSDAYGGTKQILQVQEADHNSQRPQ